MALLAGATVVLAPCIPCTPKPKGTRLDVWRMQLCVVAAAEECAAGVLAVYSALSTLQCCLCLNSAQRYRSFAGLCSATNQISSVYAVAAVAVDVLLTSLEYLQGLQARHQLQRCVLQPRLAGWLVEGVLPTVMLCSS